MPYYPLSPAQKYVIETYLGARENGYVIIMRQHQCAFSHEVSRLSGNRHSGGSNESGDKLAKRKLAAPFWRHASARVNPTIIEALAARNNYSSRRVCQSKPPTIAPLCLNGSAHRCRETVVSRFSRHSREADEGVNDEKQN